MLKKLHIFLLILSIANVNSFALSPQEKVMSENILIDILRDDALAGGPEIISRLEHLTHFDPGNDAAHYTLALKYYQKNRFKDALKEALEANSIDPANDVYKELTASLYSILGQASKSSEIYLDLLNEKPQKYSNAYTLTLLADQQLNQGKDTLALDTYSQALMYEPYYAPALVAKAEIYRMRRNYASFFATAKILTTAVAVEPEPKAQYIKAVLEHIDGRTYQVWHQQIDDMVEDCFTTHPTDSNAVRLAAEWFYSTGQVAKGEVLFNRLVELFPNDIKSHYHILQIKADKRDFAGMIEEAKIIERLSVTEQDRLTALSTLGDCYYEIGNVKEAYRCYEKALKLNPRYSPVLNNYAYFLCLEGKSLAKAEKMSKITIEQEPDNPTYLDTYGWVLHLRGKDAQAKPYFKHAMLYGGKESKDLLYHYAIVLENLGESEVASFYRSLAESKK